MTDDQKALFLTTLHDIAVSQVGVREQGTNDGPEVDEYQKAVDGREGHEAWCMAFVQWCVKQTEEKLGLHLAGFKRTEHCLTLWAHAKKNGYAVQQPEPGDIMIMQHGATTQGHTGIVVVANPDNVRAIEGNTGPGGGREGDGVYYKTRPLAGPKTGLHIVGFVRLSMLNLETT
jgi:hypothetical protein